MRVRRVFPFFLQTSEVGRVSSARRRVSSALRLGARHAALKGDAVMVNGKLEIPASEAKRLLACIVVLASRGWRVEVTTSAKVDGEYLAISLRVYDAANAFVGDAMVWVDGPYAKREGMFTASEELRPIVGVFYPYFLNQPPTSYASGYKVTP